MLISGISAPKNYLESRKSFGKHIRSTKFFMCALIFFIFAIGLLPPQSIGVTATYIIILQLVIAAFLVAVFFYHRDLNRHFAKMNF